MTIEFSLLISGISVAFAVYFGISSKRRSQKTEDKQEATQMTTVIVKLENIGNGITEIKSELCGVKKDAKEDHDKLIRVEESAKQAHKRIDEMCAKKVVEHE